MYGCSTRRHTACISTASRKVGPSRANPLRKMGASMWTKGRGTISLNPAGPGLEVADSEEVTRPGPVVIDMPEHDGGGGAEADLVCGADHVEPFAGADLVRTEHLAHLVVEDLRRRPRQGAEPRVAKRGKEVANAGAPPSPRPG